MTLSPRELPTHLKSLIVAWRERATEARAHAEQLVGLSCGLVVAFPASVRRGIRFIARRKPEGSADMTSSALTHQLALAILAREGVAAIWELQIVPLLRRITRGIPVPRNPF